VKLGTCKLRVSNMRTVSNRPTVSTRC